MRAWCSDHDSDSKSDMRSDEPAGLDNWEEFELFIQGVEAPLRRALVAAFGLERGREATIDALGWAWEHRTRLSRVDNKVAYLFRVGQSTMRKRKSRIPFVRQESTEVWFEPGLPAALAALSEKQRIAVVLVHGYQWTMHEVADLLGIRTTTVQNHVERGLQSLRAAMEVPNHA
jgi:DNA-directed RNA polymerase specialized sigma24 family protein